MVGYWFSQVPLAKDPSEQIGPQVPVDQALIDQACLALDVVELETLRDGGQKSVRLVGRDDERFVVKVISTGQSSPLAHVRASREVDILRRLDHPNVVQLASDLVELGDSPVGVAWLEEYLDGEDLSDLVGAPWQWSEAADLGYQIGRGLGAMHAERVIHRDLSANNIRRLDSGVFKVMDPGLARHELLTRVTVFGHPGTRGFMSPEHFRPLPAGPNAFSDVFCVGILMWLALTGTVPIPFHGDDADYAQRTMRSDLEDVNSVRALLNTEQFEFLLRCLHSQPARRFRDGNALANRLEELM